jgi:hypothetical protein
MTTADSRSVCYLLGLPTTETVTGTLIAAGSAQLTGNPAMSRYDPVNGWLLPDTIVVETD